VNEYAQTLRETLTALAAGDRELRRFGAFRHRYQLAPPVADLGALEHDLGTSLPEEFREHVTEIAGGGAGPYYGLVTVTRTRPIEPPAGVTAWQRALPIGHLGCGYAALLVLDGPARGQIWIDARSAGVVAPIYPSFAAYYLDWIDRLANARWAEAFVPADRCPLPNALGGYLGMCEQRLGVPPGSLAGAELAAALAELGPGAIAITAESVLFGPGDPVDPCISCARLVDNFVGQGLRRDVLVPGNVPLPDRP
jgi:hypothetical protein